MGTNNILSAMELSGEEKILVQENSSVSIFSAIEYWGDLPKPDYFLLVFNNLLLIFIKLFISKL
ncbi:MAG: hypothetical protein ACRC2J_07060 [Microcoleaceae cyanobacterium]